MAYAPDKVGRIAVACAVLHTAAISNNESLEYEAKPVLVEATMALVTDIAGGIAARNAFVSSYFVTSH